MAIGKTNAGGGGDVFLNTNYYGTSTRDQPDKLTYTSMTSQYGNHYFYTSNGASRTNISLTDLKFVLVYNAATSSWDKYSVDEFKSTFIISNPLIIGKFRTMRVNYSYSSSIAWNITGYVDTVNNNFVCICNSNFYSVYSTSAIIFFEQQQLIYLYYKTSPSYTVVSQTGYSHSGSQDRDTPTYTSTSVDTKFLIDNGTDATLYYVSVSMGRQNIGVSSSAVGLTKWDVLLEAQQ